MPGTVLLATFTWFLMLLAYRFHRQRLFHVPVMIGIMVFDLLMPVYLVMTRDWGTRLIDHGDILSFLVWAHFGLLITLYVLYALQIPAGRRLLRGEQEARAEHHAQGKGVLLVRAMVIISGGLLAEPPAD